LTGGGYHVATAVALALAVAAAVAYGLASVLQSVGARRTAGALDTLRQPVYLAGVGLDLIAWLLSLVALRTLPVYEVQSVLAGSLAVTVLAARIGLRSRLRGVDTAAVLATVLALTVIALAAGDQQTPTLGSITRWVLALGPLPVAGFGWLAARRRHAGLTAVAGGLAFGGAALCARAVTVPAAIWHRLGPALVEVGSDPLSYALAGYGVAGLVLYAHALEHGAVGPVTALLWITEVVAPAAAGLALLGDTIRTGWLAGAYLALAVTVGAAVVLASAPAQPAPAAAR
jgi:drug/metabolite transporter (DMT)-like permease